MLVKKSPKYFTKNLSSQNENYFFGRLTLIFHFSHKFTFFHKVFAHIDFWTFIFVQFSDPFLLFGKNNRGKNIINCKSNLKKKVIFELQHS